MDFRYAKKWRLGIIWTTKKDLEDFIYMLHINDVKVTGYGSVAMIINDDRLYHEEFGYVVILDLISSVGFFQRCQRQSTNYISKVWKDQDLLIPKGCMDLPD